jgi:hypothetical protein
MLAKLKGTSTPSSSLQKESDSDEEIESSRPKAFQGISMKEFS